MFRRRVCAALAACFASAAASAASNPAVTVDVDALANRHAISPYVYGVAFATAAELADLNAPLNRQGGNTTSSYNWQANADNRANDWYYESIGYAAATPGENADTFINTSRGAGAQPMITIPMLDWVAKLGANRGKLASFSVAKYGAQQSTDAAWMPDAGNGVRTSGASITGNDPNDASTPNSTAFQKSWMQHLISTFGVAASGGLKFYLLDNEPSIWHSTHRDVHPNGATMDEMRQKTIDYASAIRSVDASATIVGPEEWGWSGYLYSGYDQQYSAAHSWCCFPDRDAHGGMDYMPWLLDQLRKSELATGVKPLDVFSLHYYPQGGEFSDDTSTTMQQTRNRSTRSLWDPNYVDPTWINAKVMLIPRMKSWVSQYYPGLATAVTEYNWGAEGHINGATTQADIYGIFGREGLDYATRWETPAASTPTYKAMKLYRNYDGNKSTFGDTSVAASAPNPDNVSAFAAVRTSDGAMTVMLVNKYLANTTPITVSLANFSGNGVAQAWQLTSANTITRLANISYTGSSVAVTVPAQSVTLLVLAPGTTPPPPPPPTLPSAPTGLAATAIKGGVALNWAAAANAASYSVYMGTRAGRESTTPTQTGVTGTSATITGLSYRNTYYFKVKAVNGAGTSGYSNEASAKPLR